MRRCWKQAASQRPTFNEAVAILTDIIAQDDRFLRYQQTRRDKIPSSASSPLAAPAPPSMASGTTAVASTQF